MLNAEHHLHIRKRKAPFPAQKKHLRILDGLLIVFGIIGPFFSLPQFIEIWVYKSADGVAASSWFGYVFLNILWVIYGSAHKEKPIIITHSIWFFFNLAIGIGALIY